MAVSNGFLSWLIALIMALITIFSGSSSEVGMPLTSVVPELGQVASDSESAAQDEAVLDVDAAWALVDQAQEAYWAGDSEQAIALLRQASAAQDEEVRLVCANGLMQMGDLEGAEPVLQALVASDPQANHFLRYDLAGVLLGLGRTEEGEALLSESLALRPDDADNILSYANAVYLYLEVPDALEILGGLAASHPELADLAVVRSWLLTEQWDYAEALAATQEALTLAKAQNADLAWYYWQQYEVQKQMGDFEQALRTLNRALSPGDDLTNYLERVDLQMWNLHNVPAALADLNALALKHGSDSQVLYLRIRALLRLEEYEQARADAASIADESFSLLMRGVCALYEGETAEAVETLNAYLDLAPEDLSGLFYRAIVAMSLEDDLPAAVDYVQRAIAVNPESPDAYHLLGEAYEAMGQWTKAEAAYRTAVDLATGDAYPAQYLAMLLLAWDRHEDALAVLEAVERQYPNWNATLGGRISYLMAQGESASALERLKAYQERFVSLAEDTEPLEATMLALTGEREASLALYEKCLETPDPYVYAHYVYGLTVLGEYEQAAQALDAGYALLDASEEAPAIQRGQRIQLLVSGAELAQVQGDPDRAIDLLEQACALQWIPLTANLSPQLKPLLETEAFQDLLARYPVE